MADNLFLQALNRLDKETEKSLGYYEELRQVKINQLKMLHKMLEETIDKKGHKETEKSLGYYEGLRRVKINQLKMLHKTLEETIDKKGHVDLVSKAIKETLDELEWIAGKIEEFETSGPAEATESIEGEGSWADDFSLVSNGFFKVEFSGALSGTPNTFIQSVQVMDDEVFLRVYDAVRRRCDGLDSTVVQFRKAKKNNDRVDLVVTYEDFDGKELYKETFSDYYVDSILSELMARNDDNSENAMPLCYQVSLKKCNGQIRIFP